MRLRPAGRARFVLAFLLLGAAGFGARAGAAAPDEETDASLRSAGTETVEVRGRADELVGLADTATQGFVGQTELAARPLLRPGEILEAVPGIIITQHSGGGKANQYFLRGFNLDHGTDFRTTVEGVPVNMPSHAHGQGYTDLNFLIPELVASEEYQKGPYDARTGDFSAAGAVNVELARSLPRPIFIASGGSTYGRALAADSTRAGSGTVLGAVEYSHNDGPWVNPDDYERGNALVRWSTGDRSSGWSVTGMAYSGRWNATDQVPRRAVDAGAIGRFDTVDPSCGGDTHRYSLAGEWHRSGTRGSSRAMVYGVYYDLQLFSNFTYFLDDPVNGDQFEQSDKRFVSGFELARTWNFGAAGPGPEGERGRAWQLEAGLQVRRDDITNGLYHTRERQRLGTTREDDITQWGGGPYVVARLPLGSKVRATAGARADFYRATVASDNPLNSADADDARFSPKLALAFGPWNRTELYASYGHGFHSNDARGATIAVDPGSGEPVAKVTPLVRARGAEIGVRTQALPNLQSSLAAFGLDLDSELVFVGDAGGTAAGRPSRRTGFEWANFYRPNDRLAFDLDVAVSRGRFTDEDPAGDRIPGAVERVVAAGIAVTGVRNVFGTARLRYFGPRDLVEDGSVRSGSSTLLYATVGYAFRGGLRVSLEGFNLLDETVSDIDYFYTSQLQGEAAPVDDVHFHPAESRSFRLVVEWRP